MNFSTVCKYCNLHFHEYFLQSKQSVTNYEWKSRVRKILCPHPNGFRILMVYLYISDWPFTLISDWEKIVAFNFILFNKTHILYVILYEVIKSLEISDFQNWSPNIYIHSGTSGTTYLLCVLTSKIFQQIKIRTTLISSN